MYLLSMKPNFYLEKQNSYYITKCIEKNYEPDTSLRRTVELGPKGVCLRESSLYVYVVGLLWGSSDVLLFLALVHFFIDE